MGSNSHPGLESRIRTPPPPPRKVCLGDLELPLSWGWASIPQGEVILPSSDLTIYVICGSRQGHLPNSAGICWASGLSVFLRTHSNGILFYLECSLHNKIKRLPLLPPFSSDGPERSFRMLFEHRALCRSPVSIAFPWKRRGEKANLQSQRGPEVIGVRWRKKRGEMEEPGAGTEEERGC